MVFVLVPHIQAQKKNSRLEFCTQYRSLNPTPKTLATLSTDPRGKIFLLIETCERETVEYGAKWRNLLGNTGWGAGGMNTCEPGKVPLGATLVVHKARGAAPHALHIHNILANSGLPVTVLPLGTPSPSFSDPDGEVILLIGPRC